MKRARRMVGIVVLALLVLVAGAIMSGVLIPWEVTYRDRTGHFLLAVSITEGGYLAFDHTTDPDEMDWVTYLFRQGWSVHTLGFQPDHHPPMGFSWTSTSVRLIVHLWVFLVPCIIAIILGFLWLILTQPSTAGLCPHCRYDLRGNVSGRCPECGTAVVRTAAETSTSNADGANAAATTDDGV